jgi:hypothetical protein
MENDADDKVASSKQRTERFAMPPVTSVTCSVAFDVTASKLAPSDSPINREVVMHGSLNGSLQGRRKISTTLVELLETKYRMRQKILPCLRLPVSLHGKASKRFERVVLEIIPSKNPKCDQGPLGCRRSSDFLERLARTFRVAALRLQTPPVSTQPLFNAWRTTVPQRLLS